MATPTSEEKPSEFKLYLKDLLQCPVCIDPIKTTPIHQCANGHVICKDCIPKLNNVRVRDPLFFHFRKVRPTCRNYTTLSSSDRPKQCFTVLPEPNRTTKLKFCFPNRNRTEPNM